MSNDNPTPESTRPSSLELVRAYEERHDRLWADVAGTTVLIALTIAWAEKGDVVLTGLNAMLLMTWLLAFQQSAQNAYEYQHREGW